MDITNCKIVEVLLPAYVEGLVSEETRRFVEQHLETCEECRGTAARMGKAVEVKASPPAPSKRFLLYLNGVRLWYLLCPLAALLLLGFNFTAGWRIYEIIIEAFAVVSVLSQFFPGFNAYYRWDDGDIQKKVLEEGEKKWGRFYVKPITLAIPAIATVAIAELPALLAPSLIHL